MKKSRVRKILYTRKDHQDEFIGFGLEKSLAVGSKLPLKVGLLRRYLHLREVDNISGKGSSSTRNVFNTILIELKEIWGRTRIPIKPDSKCHDYFLKVFVEWKSIKKIGKRCSEKTREKFRASINQLCDISAKVNEILRGSRISTWKEEWLFFQNQR